MLETRLKELSEGQIKEIIGACKKLLDYYKSENKCFYWCPFCPLARSLGEHLPQGFSGCHYCPWEMFEEITCHDFLYVNKEKIAGLKERYDFAEIRNFPSWRALRIPMLENWIEKLEKELKDRKCQQ
jgi:hypothetical protein